MPLVRRFPAIFLLSVFSFALISPAVWLEPESKLPACCRRDGQHHCAMTAESSSGGAAVQSVCPAFPKAGAAPAYSKLTGVRPLQAMSVTIAAQSTLRVLERVPAPAATHRACPKRGPPVLFS